MKKNISFDDQIAQIPEERQRYIQKRVQLAAEVRRLLEKTGITQRELAARAGFQESYVSRILQGDNLTLETIAKLETALGEDLLVVPRSGKPSVSAKLRPPKKSALIDRRIRKKPTIRKHQ